MKTIPTPLSPSQYYQTVHPKHQIVLHHTVSNGNAKNVVASWAHTPARIGVAFVIDREGEIHQCFSSKHWAHHLGVKAKNKKSGSFDNLNVSSNTQLNKQSIGIELCAWGPLQKIDDKFYTTTGKLIPNDEVIQYNELYRGSWYYQSYTTKQLASLKELLQYLCTTYKIPTTYQSEMWSLSRTALSGSPGIWSHISFRKDKRDCHPQKELIEIIKSL